MANPKIRYEVREWAYNKRTRKWRLFQVLKNVHSRKLAEKFVREYTRGVGNVGQFYDPPQHTKYTVKAVPRMSDSWTGV